MQRSSITDTFGLFAREWRALAAPFCMDLTWSAFVLVLFLIFPISSFTVYAFSITTGLLWLATVPPTSGLVAQMFGLRYMGTLYGIVFLSHQLGSFSGVWLGGYLFDSTGSYDVVWWATAIIAAVTAFIHVFIDERPVARMRLNQAKV